MRQSITMHPTQLSEYTGYLIRRAQQAHVAVWQREVSAEVTSVQFGVLNVLAGTPGASQQELVVQLDLDRSTIADIVSRLERRGLIARARDLGDRRRNVLRLTDDGRAELAALQPRVARVDEVLTGALDASEREQLRHLLAAVLRATAPRKEE
ncbi:MarR family winged helix-turn-helix transcriptional regulator [Herbiconiux daphne]|uniref:MarR family winged helix-turn-helix transcriptional regulator n=1 Tax=Herbiconiux daphne TaxID=2970914 RepID=A0ABT2H3Q5_9MICO|nr:MarR family winged helix-turn-helix transcriptional regulator [Herbiconiux daphne]MCS5734557.1 MarR family winged helix-turn-helix transcriptional regulator [Herbiconiux daphne]